ncbi:MAG TPA: lysophospholipid acyltransferase family protein [Thauera aminoaromatica]|nr:lysophospholipid acyltransferase family protein [Thauera aminoaromatica]
MSRLVIGLIWLLHWLPLVLLARVGSGFGGLLYWVVVPRRKVALTNLRLCFPELSEPERRALARRNFALIGRSMLERGLAWWASPERLRATVRIEGLAHLQRLRAEGRPVLLLAPHFLGLDMAGTRLTLEGDFVSVYSPQKDKVFDHWLHHGRSRFNDQLLLSRHDGVRATVKAMKSGRPFYYLPDLDYGRKESIFVPFFGVQAATITGLPRLARLAGAAVVPCITRILPGGQGYVLELGAPWADYPSDDVEADTLRMNAWLEGVVRTMPEQYYWVHRRFKTRPEGEPRIY